MDATAEHPNHPAESLSNQVRSAVIWRSGSQILAQLVQWAATFLVIRILDPQDYGLFAMTGVVLVFLNMLNGYGLASGLIQKPDITQRDIRQLFGMLLLLNGVLAAAQVLILAPAAAAYYRQPIVADMLRVQALFYFATPFIALHSALLSRTLEFRLQARVAIVASLASASAALGGALGGLGVWTLVLAPLVLFGVRAIGMTIAAKSLVWPSFDFRGAGRLARYGGVIAVGQLLAFIWSQSDVFIGGRFLSPTHLGFYTTSLFLVQIVVSKIVPPLNDVAFAAYARLQDNRAALAEAFLKMARVVMVIAMPFYFGLAATSVPLVETVLGNKWVGAAPIAALLALSMPFYTIYVLLGPVTDALGRPGIAARNGLIAALLAPVAVSIAAPLGVMALASCWLVIFPLLFALSARRTLPIIGVTFLDLLRAIIQPVAAATAMGLIVTIVDHFIDVGPSPLRLGVLVACGAAAYGSWLLVFGRDTVHELLALIRPR